MQERAMYFSCINIIMVCFLVPLILYLQILVVVIVIILETLMITVFKIHKIRNAISDGPKIWNSIPNEFKKM